MADSDSDKSFSRFSDIGSDMSQSLVLRYFWVTTRLKIRSNKLMNMLI